MLLNKSYVKQTYSKPLNFKRYSALSGNMPCSTANASQPSLNQPRLPSPTPFNPNSIVLLTTGAHVRTHVGSFASPFTFLTVCVRDFFLSQTNVFSGIASSSEKWNRTKSRYFTRLLAGIRDRDLRSLKRRRKKNLKCNKILDLHRAPERN